MGCEKLIHEPTARACLVKSATRRAAASSCYYKQHEWQNVAYAAWKRFEAGNSEASEPFTAVDMHIVQAIWL
jgi:hypothetical protein